MDACDRPRADVIDQMAEDNPIHERSPQVLMQADLEPHLDALGSNQKEAVVNDTPHTRQRYTIKPRWEVGYTI